MLIFDKKEDGFESERALEDYVAAHPEVAGCRAIIARQARVDGLKIDLIGVADSGAPTVIEVKNQTATARALGQAMEYAVALERNIDGVRELAGKGGKGNGRNKNGVAGGKSRKEIVLADAVKIVVIAPRITDSAVEIAGRSTFEVDFVRVRRWRSGKGGGKKDIVLAEVLTENYAQNIGTGTSPLRSTCASPGFAIVPSREWTVEAYEQRYNGDAVPEFFKRTEEMAKIAARLGVDAEPSFTAKYSAFRRMSDRRGRPGRIVFGVRWLGTVSIGAFFKLSKEQAESALRGSPLPLHCYSAVRREAVVKLEDSFKLSRLLRLFRAASSKMFPP